LISSLQLAFGITTFSAAACGIVAATSSDPATSTPVFVSAFIATGNALCALLLSHLGLKSGSMKAFFRAVFGGMVLRMATTLFGLLIGIKVFLLSALPFAGSLLAFTLVFMAAEVSVWSRQDFSSRVQPS
jgi:hypothetical protein